MYPFAPRGGLLRKATVASSTKTCSTSSSSSSSSSSVSSPNEEESNSAILFKKTKYHQAFTGLISRYMKKVVHFDTTTLPLPNRSNSSTSSPSRCHSLIKQDILDEAHVMRSILSQTQEERVRFQVDAIPRSCASYHLIALAREEREEEARVWEWFAGLSMEERREFCEGEGED